MVIQFWLDHDLNILTLSITSLTHPLTIKLCGIRFNWEKKEKKQDQIENGHPNVDGQPST